MTYQVGQMVPLDYQRSLVGRGLSQPVWHALIVASQREKFVCRQLKRSGVRAIYPRHIVQWRDARTSKTRRVKNPLIAGIIYAKFNAEPQWDIMRDRGLVRGVFSYRGAPIALPRDVILGVMSIKARATRLKDAREALLKVLVGDTAEIIEGPLEGFMVDVTDIRNGMVFWEHIGDLPFKGQSSFKQLRRCISEQQVAEALALDG